MQKVYAVIGAGWGDEGKGLAVDAITARLNGDVLVVRSNGGAQAGHGVHTPDGRHHVFHHIGSGSFNGARTHLSRFFVGQPMVFASELDELKAKCAEDLNISMDPRSLITTPWDMAINQSLELIRNEGRHGSCGLGFGEAIERSEGGYSLQFCDLIDGSVVDKAHLILSEWVPKRMAELGLDCKEFPLKEILTGETDVTDRYLEDCAAFSEMIRPQNDGEIKDADHIVFEGAQGLRLDMNFGEFPHVTRSNTGLKNILQICDEAGLEDLEAIYMTRAYGTRHGAGPFPFEVGEEAPEYAEVVDLTNKPNDWQGKMRYGHLDVAGLGEIINKDMKLSWDTGVYVTGTLGITCLDQIIDRAHFKMHETTLKVAQDQIAMMISNTLARDITLLSFGPDRSKVEFAPNFEIDDQKPQGLIM